MDSLRDSGCIPSKALLNHSKDGAPVIHMGVTQGVLGPGLSLTCLRAQTAGTPLAGGYCCKLYYGVFLFSRNYNFKLQNTPIAMKTLILVTGGKIALFLQANSLAPKNGLSRLLWPPLWRPQSRVPCPPTLFHSWSDCMCKHTHKYTHSHVGVCTHTAHSI